MNSTKRLYGPCRGTTSKSLVPQIELKHPTIGDPACSVADAAAVATD